MKYNFKNDYATGAHPHILKRLTETNDQQEAGYGEDSFSAQARELIKQQLNNPKAVIYFLSGGTQTNLIVIAAQLRAHEAVISAKTGHIYANETGAIEATGHRIITVESPDGKLTPDAVSTVLKEYALRPHVVKPKMVYISNSTEVGTHYQLQELQHLYAFCRANKLLLFMDGARLGHALTAKNNDLTLKSIGILTDIFYIGGTKNGALLGEAVVFNRPELASEFDYVLKQRGALLAKGRILGIQFLELFNDDLYFKLATHANKMAEKIVQAMKRKGFRFLSESDTNQIFPILPIKLIDRLKEKYLFYVWQTIDKQHSAVRLITSWATEEKKVDEFIKDLESSE